MQLAATVFLTAICGLLWGGLAYGLEVAHSLWLALSAGMAIGVLMGFLIQPLRDVEWPATAALSLIGLYVAVALFAIGYAIGELTTAGNALAIWPSAIAETTWAFVFGLSMSGYVFLLWPLAFANHALVWWCQRRNEALAAGS